jgi:hypothetical protein
MSKATIAHAKRHRDHLRDLLKQLDDHTIEDLERRGRYTPTPDGMPTGTGNGNGRGTDISRPTEQAATRRITDTPTADPIGNLAARIFNNLRTAHELLATLDHDLEVIRGYGTPAGRTSTLAGDCHACLRPVAGGARDPIRNGYCNACRSAYIRWTEDNPVTDDPAAHRQAFERHRRATLATRPDPHTRQLIEQRCDHQCCTSTQPHKHFHQAADCPACNGIAPRPSILAGGDAA